MPGDKSPHYYRRVPSSDSRNFRYQNASGCLIFSKIYHMWCIGHFLDVFASHFRRNTQTFKRWTRDARNTSPVYTPYQMTSRVGLAQFPLIFFYSPLISPPPLSTCFSPGQAVQPKTVRSFTSSKINWPWRPGRKIEKPFGRTGL